MSDYDFSGDKPMQPFELIPSGTVAPVVATIRPGGIGDGGYATASQTSDVTYLSLELTVLEGPCAGRKFWQNMTVSGGKLDENGQSKAVNISRSTLRSILDSAYGLDPDDDSPATAKKRVVAGWSVFDGIQFVASISLEKGKNGYKDSNRIGHVITKGHKDYVQLAQPNANAQRQAYAAPHAARQAAPAQQSSPKTSKPSWMT